MKKVQKERLRKLFDKFCNEANIDQRKVKLDYLFDWYTEVAVKTGMRNLADFANKFLEIKQVPEWQAFLKAHGLED